MKRVGLVTFARSEYSTCRPLLRAIRAAPELELVLLVGGMHLAPEFGLSVREIEADGFPIQARIEFVPASDTPEAMAKSIGQATIGLADALARCKPAVLLVIGDRLELLAVASAALPMLIPLAHVSGGDLTEGAIDNQVRFALSKLSHLHFVAMQEHADRLRQLGEENERIFVTGEPALDELRHMQFTPRAELAALLGIELIRPLILVTYHPTTLGDLSPAQEIEALVDALRRVDGTFVITAPNADVGNRVIAARLEEFVAGHRQAVLVRNLGQQVYYSLMHEADLMVGNSSSGLWEAPSFRLPVVNVGDR